MWVGGLHVFEEQEENQLRKILNSKKKTRIIGIHFYQERKKYKSVLFISSIVFFWGIIRMSQNKKIT